ncbi:MAG: glycosyltransferase family 4 protein [Nannocystaceae bacterium]|nr:glycosyltransferase family 4 protein [Nannocystaceae bacterium]
MRLLLVSRDFPPAIGGIQTTIVELARHLTMLGHSVVVLAPTHPDTHSVDQALPFEVVRLRTPWQQMNAAVVGAILQLCAQRSFDASLHALWHTLPGALAARAMGRLGVVTAIGHGRELRHNEWRSRARRLQTPLRQQLSRRVNTWFAVSRFTRDLLVEDGIDPAKIRLTHGGVDVKKFAPQRPMSSSWGLKYVAEPLLVTVSRLVRRKGIDTVLDALPTIRDAIPSVRYLVGGVGPDAERLHKKRDDLKLRGTVRFLGHVHDTDHVALLSDATAFVMPVRSRGADVEGFGLSFLEANACGTPVIGARAGGVPDAVEHQGTGLLVPADDPHAFAAAALEMLRNEPARERMRQRGIERVNEDFTWSAVARRYERGLEACLR